LGLAQRTPPSVSTGALKYAFAIARTSDAASEFPARSVTAGVIDSGADEDGDAAATSATGAGPALPLPHPARLMLGKIAVETAKSCSCNGRVRMTGFHFIWQLHTTKPSYLRETSFAIAVGHVAW
jgi:hypothetical protein